MPDKYPQLRRAPITEALLDFRVLLPDGCLLSELTAAFGKAVATEYPERRPITQFQVDFDEAAFGTQTSRDVGAIFWTSDKKRALQARNDGFSVNHVGAYKDWDTLIEDARRRWPAYLAAANPTKVVRCAARFINRIEIRIGDDLKTHLRTFPEIGAGLPSLLDGYSFRCILPFENDRMAAITQTTVPSDESGGSASRALLLDIDAFSEREFAPGSNDLWAELDELRKIKNACFFNSLQPATWEAYR